MGSDNLQTTQLQESAGKKDSTHSDATQASALWLIHLLRKAYPKINTQLLMGLTSAASIENEPAKAVITAQQQLLDYLQSVIQALESNATTIPFPSGSLNQAIYDTTLVAYLITKSSYTSEEKKNALKKMRSIANTAPGFSWTQEDSHWSTNVRYNPENQRKESEITSPAETLNLVCSALIDKTRFQTPTNESSFEQEKTFRIDSFCKNLFRMQQEENEGNFEFCASARQHEPLFLLDHTYLDKPNDEGGKPISLPRDTSSLILDSLSDFIKHELTKLTTEQQTEIISDWILYKNNLIEREIAPVISFLRKQYPALKKNSSATAAASGTGEENNWMNACQIYVSTCLAENGIDPNNHREQIADFIKAIETINPPDPEAAITQAILQYKTCHPVNSTNSFFKLITARNHYIEATQKRLSQKNEITTQEKRQLFEAEELFQKIYQNHNHICLLNDQINQNYQTALTKIQTALLTYFKENVFPEGTHFEKDKLAYASAYQTIKNTLQIDFIENFFIDHNNVMHHWKKFLSFQEGELGDPSKHPLFITDEQLAHLIVNNITDMNSNSGNVATLEISSYTINRVFLHAMLVDQGHWSKDFQETLSLIINWLSQPISDKDSWSQLAIKKTRLAYFYHLAMTLSDEKGDLDTILHLISMNQDAIGNEINKNNQVLLNRYKSPRSLLNILKLLKENKFKFPEDILYFTILAQEFCLDSPDEENDEEDVIEAFASIRDLGFRATQENQNHIWTLKDIVDCKNIEALNSIFKILANFGFHIESDHDNYSNLLESILDNTNLNSLHSVYHWIEKINFDLRLLASEEENGAIAILNTLAKKTQGNKDIAVIFLSLHDLGFQFHSKNTTGLLLLENIVSHAKPKDLAEAFHKIQHSEYNFHNDIFCFNELTNHQNPLILADIFLILKKNKFIIEEKNVTHLAFFNKIKEHENPDKLKNAFSNLASNGFDLNKDTWYFKKCMGYENPYSISDLFSDLKQYLGFNIDSTNERYLSILEKLITRLEKNKEHFCPFMESLMKLKTGHAFTIDSRNDQHLSLLEKAMEHSNIQAVATAFQKLSEVEKYHDEKGALLVDLLNIIERENPLTFFETSKPSSVSTSVSSSASLFNPTSGSQAETKTTQPHQETQSIKKN